MECFLSLMSLQTWISSYVFCNCLKMPCNVTAAFCWAEKNWNAMSFKTFKSSRQEVFLRKGVLKNMQQIYRRTPIPKCDFNKVALQLYWNCTLTCVFCCKFATYFQNTFSKEDRWVAASAHTNGRWCFKCFICKNSSDEQSAFDRL